MAIRGTCTAQSGSPLLASLKRCGDGQRFDFAAKRFVPPPAVLPFTPSTIPAVETAYGAFEVRYDATTDRAIFPNDDYQYFFHASLGIKPVVAACTTTLVDGDDISKPPVPAVIQIITPTGTVINPKAV